MAGRGQTLVSPGSSVNQISFHSFQCSMADGAALHKLQPVSSEAEASVGLTNASFFVASPVQLPFNSQEPLNTIRQRNIPPMFFSPRYMPSLLSKQVSR